MLYTYSNITQNLVSDEIITFSTNSIQTGCTATHAAGTGSISLNKPGFYMVHFNGDISSATTGLATAQLLANGVEVAGAEASRSVGTEGNISGIAFTAIVRVAPNCCVNTNNVPLTLTVANSGVAATYSNAAITVTKIA